LDLADDLILEAKLPSPHVLLFEHAGSKCDNLLFAALEEVSYDHADERGEYF
jgi:hypothetical protein